MSTVLVLPRMASYHRRKLETVALVLLLNGRQFAIHHSFIMYFKPIRRGTSKAWTVGTNGVISPTKTSHCRPPAAVVGHQFGIHHSSLDSLQSASQGGNVNSTRPGQDGVISPTKTSCCRTRAAVVGHQFAIYHSSLDSLQSDLKGGNVTSTRPRQDGVITPTKTSHCCPRADVVGHQFYAITRQHCDLKIRLSQLPKYPWRVWAYQRLKTSKPREVETSVAFRITSMKLA